MYIYIYLDEYMDRNYSCLLFYHRERGFFGWLLIGKYLELDVDKKKIIKLNSDPSLTSSTPSMALQSSPYPTKTLVLPQYPLNDPPA